MNDAAIVSPEVRDALFRGDPVVALESTILSHGMPYPQNVQTAMEVERIVREHGAVPATIAVLDGKVHAGVSPAQIERLGQGRGITKVSRADLASVIAAGGSGATTVAATMICAQLAQIRVFATGGIGGVHRGAERTFDVSADLYELARTPVCVVCAGAKALLDIPKTLEVLETLGVPVIGYRTNEFPAFWSASSGLPLALRCDTAQAVADIVRTQDTLGISGGVLVAVPVPAEHEIARNIIEDVVERALDEASAQRVTGKALTPFVLDRIFRLTDGKSLATNVALVKNNAAVAAQVAAAL